MNNEIQLKNNIQININKKNLPEEKPYEPKPYKPYEPKPYKPYEPKPYEPKSQNYKKNSTTILEDELKEKKNLFKNLQNKKHRNLQNILLIKNEYSSYSPDLKKSNQIKVEKLKKNKSITENKIKLVKKEIEYSELLLKMKKFLNDKIKLEKNIIKESEQIKEIKKKYIFFPTPDNRSAKKNMEKKIKNMKSIISTYDKEIKNISKRIEEL